LPGSNFIRGSIAAAGLRVNTFVSIGFAAGEGRRAIHESAESDRQKLFD
jgi:hypothetical protein